MNLSKVGNNPTRAMLVVVAILTVAVLTGALASPAAAQSDTAGTVAQTDNETAETVCEPGPDEPQLSQSRLYAPQQEITSGEPGQIAGGFQVAADASCPVVVSITMSVPSGMSISGSSDIVSGGAGLVSAQFTVSPGEIRDIRANVYSENTGDRSVTADLTYWPEGHEDMSREIDGISLNFDVQEPVTQESTNSNSTSTGNDSGITLNSTTLLAFGGFALVILAIVAVATRS